MINRTSNTIGSVSLFAGATSLHVADKLKYFRPIVTTGGNVLFRGTQMYQTLNVFGIGAKYLGNIGSGIGFVYTATQWSTNQISTSMAVSDFGFGVIGFFGVPGLAVSGLYSAFKIGSPNYDRAKKEYEAKYCVPFSAFIENGGFCFARGSLILTPVEKYIPIEEIKVGDEVFSLDFTSMKLVSNIVYKIDSVYHDNIVRIHLDGDIVNINTDDHPYYTKNKGLCSFNPELTFKNYQIKVSKLQEGDICYYILGKSICEIKIDRIVRINEKQITYNLSCLSIYSNYIVNGVVVSTEQNNNK